MKSFISWIGGKNLLKKEIINQFPKEKFEYYIEVFGGAAWVLFEKDSHAEIEIYNDLNGELTNLFKCVKFHCDAVQTELQFVLNSRAMFEEYKHVNTSYLTDIQRAARFFMLIKTSYGSKGGTFGCVKKNVSVMVNYLKEIEYRLKNVIIENKDFEELISKFSSKDVLFFLDPPYYGTEKYYSAEFTNDDHTRLYNCLRNAKSKFILTYNDCETIREMYKEFTILETKRYNNLTSKYKNGNYYNELIIKNY